MTGVAAVGFRVGFRACLVAAVLALAGCGGMKNLTPDFDLRSFISKSSDVDFGMTKSRVTYTMGTPKRRIYEASQEAWLWCQTSNSRERADAFLTVYFNNARVAGIHTYGNRAEGECDNFFRPVEWLVDPDKAMAEKKRRREN